MECNAAVAHEPSAAESQWGTSIAEGFICPECKEHLLSNEALLEHYNDRHSQLISAAGMCTFTVQLHGTLRCSHSLILTRFLYNHHSLLVCKNSP